MSENGSHKSFRNLTTADNPNPHISANGASKNQTKRTSALNNLSTNEIQPEISQKCISNAITIHAQAIQQAAARLQQQQHQQETLPVMAKKSNINPTISSKSNGQGPSSVLQLNLVNENGIVTPIEINASVAAAAAIVAAQKQHKPDPEGTRNFISTSMNSNGVADSLVNIPRSIDAGAKCPKVPPHGNVGQSVHVS